MKTRLIVMAGMLMISTAIVAQQKENRELRKPENRGEQMKAALELTDQQYASLKDLRLKYAKKQNESRAKFEKLRQEERATLQSLRIEREQEMRKLLTPAQTRKLDELRAAQKEKRAVNGKQMHYRKHFRPHHRDFKRDSLKHDRKKGEWKKDGQKKGELKKGEQKKDEQKKD